MTTLRRLLSIPSARVCLVILAAVIFLAVFGGALAPYGALSQSPQILRGSSAEHLLGTDYVGRDVLSRLMAGTRLSVVGAVEAVLVGTCLGVPMGLASVWAGRIGEWFALRVSETLTVLPFTVFTIAVAATLGNGMNQAMIAVGILSAPTFFRISRAVALGLRTTQYVESAELMGASTWWILRTHMWSKVLPNVAVAAAQASGAALLIIASLAFLGIGVTPPTPTWGGMLSSDLGYLELQPWAPLFPGVPMLLTVGALNILADCIREAGSDAPYARRRLFTRLLGRRPSTTTAATNPAVPTEELDRVTA